MKASSLYFLAPGEVEVRREDLPAPAAGEVQVHSTCSAISAGTELLLFGGQLPEGLPVDEDLPALQGDLAYPLKYGYCAVGRVKALGEGVDPSWAGRRVFAFHPHQSTFNARPKHLQPLPEGLDAEDAAFLANLETAIGLVMDADPRLGERVAVLGQGVVGLLTTLLLARHPLSLLLSLDRYPKRRDASLECGAAYSLDPAAPDALVQARDLLGSQGADLVFELSGQPEALDSALALAGAQGRVVVGSWYGQRRAPLALDTHFHRGRINLLSSQVGHIQPALRGRWDKARRFQLAWELLPKLRPSRFISHRFPLDAAPEAYRLLSQHPDQALAVLFTYA